jgi:hypothetical protein
MKAEAAQASLLQCELVAAVERGTVEVVPVVPIKTRSSSESKIPRALSFARASATAGAIGTEPTLPDFGVVSDRSSRTSASQDSAVRFVKYPAGEIEHR